MSSLSSSAEGIRNPAMPNRIAAHNNPIITTAEEICKARRLSVAANRILPPSNGAAGSKLKRFTSSDATALLRPHTVGIRYAVAAQSKPAAGPAAAHTASSALPNIPLYYIQSPAASSRRADTLPPVIVTAAQWPNSWIVKPGRSAANQPLSSRKYSRG